jgi:hypothetical protein
LRNWFDRVGGREADEQTDPQEQQKPIASQESTQVEELLFRGVSLGRWSFPHFEQVDKASPRW